MHKCNSLAKYSFIMLITEGLMANSGAAFYAGMKIILSGSGIEISDQNRCFG